MWQMIQTYDSSLKLDANIMYDFVNENTEAALMIKIYHYW